MVQSRHTATLSTPVSAEMGLIGTTLFVINTTACIGAQFMAVDIEEAVEQVHSTFIIAETVYKHTTKIM